MFEIAYLTYIIEKLFKNIKNDTTKNAIEESMSNAVINFQMYFFSFYWIDMHAWRIYCSSYYDTRNILAIW